MEKKAKKAAVSQSQSSLLQSYSILKTPPHENLPSDKPLSPETEDPSTVPETQPESQPKSQPKRQPTTILDYLETTAESKEKGKQEKTHFLTCFRRRKFIRGN